MNATKDTNLLNELFVIVMDWSDDRGLSTRQTACILGMTKNYLEFLNECVEEKTSQAIRIYEGSQSWLR